MSSPMIEFWRISAVVILTTFFRESCRLGHWDFCSEFSWWSNSTTIIQSTRNSPNLQRARCSESVHPIMSHAVTGTAGTATEVAGRRLGALGLSKHTAPGRGLQWPQDPGKAQGLCRPGLTEDCRVGEGHHLKTVATMILHGTD